MIPLTYTDVYSRTSFFLSSWSRRDSVLVKCTVFTHYFESIQFFSSSIFPLLFHCQLFLLYCFLVCTSEKLTTEKSENKNFLLVLQLFLLPSPLPFLTKILKEYSAFRVFSLTAIWVLKPLLHCTCSCQGNNNLVTKFTGQFSVIISLLWLTRGHFSSGSSKVLTLRILGSLELCTQPSPDQHGLLK